MISQPAPREGTNEDSLRLAMPLGRMRTRRANHRIDRSSSSRDRNRSLERIELLLDKRRSSEADLPVLERVEVREAGNGHHPA